MHEKARRQGFFPQVNARSLTDQLLARKRLFDKNAALGALLARRRMWNESMRYDTQFQESMDQNARARMPNMRAGLSGAIGAENVRDQLLNPAVKIESDEEEAPRRP